VRIEEKGDLQIAIGCHLCCKSSTRSPGESGKAPRGSSFLLRQAHVFCDNRPSGGPRLHSNAPVVCTHFVQPSAYPVLERIGLDQLIERAGGVPNGIDLWSRYCIPSTF
jgi:hypothetical protein